MTSARFLVGDVRKVLGTLPDNSVDLVLTSPPFLALRSYLPADHPDKALEMGSEPTPGEFIDALLDVVEECDRVLAPHGSIAIELGDTYAGSGGAGGDYGPEGMRGGQEKFNGSALKDRKNKVLRADGNRLQQGPGWPLERSLCLIPELFRVSLVYGFNPLTGRQTPRWRARNVVRWCRPNPPVGALGDKFRPATSEMVVLCKDRRYFDLDAVRTPLTEPGAIKHHSTEQRNAKSGWASNNAEIRQNEAGAPPLDWWKISTQPYPWSHYATWPEDLCVIPIKSMCPLKVCRVCGKPSERIAEVEYVRDTRGGTNGVRRDLEQPEGHDGGMAGEGVMAKIAKTVGWSDCGHDDWRTGVVLDPFAGSGTTLAVATGHGRDAIGIDLDASNADLAMERVGPLLLEVEDLRPNREGVA